MSNVEEIDYSETKYRLEDIFGSFEMKGETHHYVDHEIALGILLLNGVLFSNHFHYVDCDGTKYPRTTVLFVNCNDLFAWACADAEELPHDEIGNLFRMWHENPKWGPSKWCCIRRNLKPQKPIVTDMKKDGAWDEVMEKLEDNP